MAYGPDLMGHSLLICYMCYAMVSLQWQNLWVVMAVEEVKSAEKAECCPPSLSCKGGAHDQILLALFRPYA